MKKYLFLVLGLLLWNYTSAQDEIMEESSTSPVTSEETQIENKGEEGLKNSASKKEKKDEEEIEEKITDTKQVAPSEKIQIRGSGHILFGQVVSGYAYGRAGSNPIKNHWQNFYSARVDLTSQPVEWYKTKLSLEIGSAWPILRESTIMKETYKLQYRSILPQAVGVFNFNIEDYLFFLIEAGMMEYAFNEEVKNLGNYLYRSTVYPFNLTTKLDYIYSNLLGTRGEIGINNIKLGLIFNSIINQAPFFDMSLSLYLTFKDPIQFFDGGIALGLDRLIAINDTLTDCINLRSTLGDTTLTLRGQKIDLRAAFDLKKLFGRDNDFVSMLGEKDLKIYTEAALIGFRDPEYFPGDTAVPKPSLLHRLPILFGINLPAFKILNVFSVEFEWCKYPYAFDWWGYTNAAPSPKPPYPGDTLWRKIYRDEDNFKWTVYLKSSISKFDIIAFFANDHIRYETHNAEQQLFTEQSLRRGNNWHWYVKLQYNL